jgi:hypothetical protein
MDGVRGLDGWQWMFLIEALPMIPLGVITWLFLNNIPNTVQGKRRKKYILNMLIQLKFKG